MQSNTEISRKSGSVAGHMRSPRDNLRLVGLTIHVLAITGDRESFDESGDRVRSGSSVSDVSEREREKGSRMCVCGEKEREGWGDWKKGRENLNNIFKLIYYM